MNITRVNKLIKMVRFKITLRLTPVTHQDVRNDEPNCCRNQRPVTVKESNGWQLQDQLGNGTIDKIENGLAVAEHSLKHWRQDHVQA